MSKIDGTYHNLLRHIFDNGYVYKDPNRKNIKRLEIPSYQIQHSFEDGFPVLTTKKIHWKSIVGELLWFLRGDTNIKYLLDNNINIWNKDAYNYYCNLHNNYSEPNGFLDYATFLLAVKDNSKSNIIPNYKFGDLGRTYSAQWREWIGFKQFKKYAETVYTDQIYNLVKGLKENPMGTRHIVTAWNPAELDKMALPPCHWSFEILVEPKRGNLDKWKEVMSKSEFNSKFPYYKKQYQFTLKWHQRSVDSFLGKM